MNGDGSYTPLTAPPPPSISNRQIPGGAWSNYGRKVTQPPNPPDLQPGNLGGHDFRVENSVARNRTNSKVSGIITGSMVRGVDSSSATSAPPMNRNVIEPVKANPVKKPFRLPEMVLSCVCKLTLYLDDHDCGIVELQGRDGEKAYCLFLAKVFVSHTITAVADQLYIGQQMRVNARLVKSEFRTQIIPYLASMVIADGVNEGILENFRDPTSEDYEVYYRLGPKLRGQLEMLNGQSEDVIEILDDEPQVPKMYNQLPPLPTPAPACHPYVHPYPQMSLPPPQIVYPTLPPVITHSKGRNLDNLTRVHINPPLPASSTLISPPFPKQQLLSQPKQYSKTIVTPLAEEFMNEMYKSVDGSNPLNLTAEQMKEQEQLAEEFRKQQLTKSKKSVSSTIPLADKLRQMEEEEKQRSLLKAQDEAQKKWQELTKPRKVAITQDIDVAIAKLDAEIQKNNDDPVNTSVEVLGSTNPGHQIEVLGSSTPGNQIQVLTPPVSATNVTVDKYGYVVRTNVPSTIPLVMTNLGSRPPNPQQPAEYYKSLFGDQGQVGPNQKTQSRSKSKERRSRKTRSRSKSKDRRSRMRKSRSRSRKRSRSPVRRARNKRPRSRSPRRRSRSKSPIKRKRSCSKSGGRLKKGPGPGSGCPPVPGFMLHPADRLFSGGGSSVRKRMMQQKDNGTDEVNERMVALEATLSLIQKMVMDKNDLSKEYCLICMEGEILDDGDYKQFTQIGVSVEEADTGVFNKTHFRSILPTYMEHYDKNLILRNQNSLHSSLNLKYNEVTSVYHFVHVKKGEETPVSEEKALEDVISFIKTVKGNKEVVIYTHSNASIVPLLLARLLHYKKYDRFSKLVRGFADFTSCIKNLKFNGFWQESKFQDLIDVYKHIMGKQWPREKRHSDGISVLSGCVLKKLITNFTEYLEECSLKFSLFKFLSISGLSSVSELKKLHSKEIDNTESRSNLDKMGVKELELKPSDRPAEITIIILKRFECIEVLDVDEVEEEGINEDDYFDKDGLGAVVTTSTVIKPGFVISVNMKIRTKTKFSSSKKNSSTDKFYWSLVSKNEFFGIAKIEKNEVEEGELDESKKRVDDVKKCEISRQIVKVQRTFKPCKNDMAKCEEINVIQVKVLNPLDVDITFEVGDEIAIAKSEKPRDSSDPDRKTYSQIKHEAELAQEKQETERRNQLEEEQKKAAAKTTKNKRKRKRKRKKRNSLDFDDLDFEPVESDEDYDEENISSEEDEALFNSIPEESNESLTHSESILQVKTLGHKERNSTGKDKSKETESEKLKKVQELRDKINSLSDKYLNQKELSQEITSLSDKYLKQQDLRERISSISNQYLKKSDGKTITQPSSKSKSMAKSSQSHSSNGTSNKSGEPLFVMPTPVPVRARDITPPPPGEETVSLVGPSEPPVMPTPVRSREITPPPPGEETISVVSLSKPPIIYRPETSSITVIPTENLMKNWSVKKLKNCLGLAGLHQYGLKMDLVKRLADFYQKNPSKVVEAEQIKKPLSSEDVAKHIIEELVVKACSTNQIIDMDELEDCGKESSSVVFFDLPLPVPGRLKPKGAIIPVLGSNQRGNILVLDADGQYYSNGMPIQRLEGKIVENEDVQKKLADIKLLEKKNIEFHKRGTSIKCTESLELSSKEKKVVTFQMPELDLFVSEFSGRRILVTPFLADKKITIVRQITTILINERKCSIEVLVSYDGEYDFALNGEDKASLIRVYIERQLKDMDNHFAVPEDGNLIDNAENYFEKETIDAATTTDIVLKPKTYHTETCDVKLSKLVTKDQLLFIQRTKASSMKIGMRKMILVPQALSFLCEDGKVSITMYNASKQTLRISKKTNIALVRVQKPDIVDGREYKVELNESGRGGEVLKVEISKLIDNCNVLVTNKEIYKENPRISRLQNLHGKAVFLVNHEFSGSKSNWRAKIMKEI